MINPETPNRDQLEGRREVFLAEISRVLSKRLSPLETYESIREMRGHIDAMAAAYQELGMEPGEAMDAALDKFGKPKRLGLDLTNAITQRAQISKPLALIATCVAEFALGAVGFQLIEIFFNSQFTVNTDPSVDLVFGGVAGGMVGIVAWLWKWSPKALGVLLCIPINVMLVTQLYPQILQLGRPERFFEIAFVLNAALYFVSVSGVTIARWLSSGVPTQAVSMRPSAK